MKRGGFLFIFSRELNIPAGGFQENQWWGICDRSLRIDFGIFLDVYYFKTKGPQNSLEKGVNFDYRKCKFHGFVWVWQTLGKQFQNHRKC